jgi:hypothetical protein
LDALERLPPSDEGREDEVAERSVVEQECAQRVAVDRDVAQRFGHDRRHEHGLSGQEVQFAEKARRAVADDIVASRVTDRDLALTNGDERIRAIADPVQHVVDGCRPLLAQLRKRRQLRGRQRGDGGNCHRGERSDALPVCVDLERLDVALSASDHEGALERGQTRSERAATAGGLTGLGLGRFRPQASGEGEAPDRDQNQILRSAAGS